MDVTILPPPVSVVLVGISPCCGSLPFAVMMAELSPVAAGSSAPGAQPVSASALADTSARAPMPMRDLFNFPPVQVECLTERDCAPPCVYLYPKQVTTCAPNRLEE